MPSYKISYHQEFWYILNYWETGRQLFLWITIQCWISLITRMNDSPGDFYSDDYDNRKMYRGCLIYLAITWAKTIGRRK